MNFEFKNKPDVIKFRDKINTQIEKNWFVLHILFIAFYILYVIYKIYHGGSVFSDINSEVNASFSLTWFIVNVIGFVLIAIVLISNTQFKFWKYIAFISFGFFLITISYIKTVDSDLEWLGSDVALGNYISANETAKYGAFETINTWNDRANPYNYKNINKDFKDEIRNFIERNNLSNLSFNKWKNNLDTTKYDLVYNNRPYMHPPLTAVLTGLWLKNFPFGRWSVECLMILFTFLSILTLVILSYKRGGGDFRNIILISIATSPVMFKFYIPSAEQLGMLLFTIPLFIFFLLPSFKFWISFLYGIIYGLCFYTKFNVIFFIVLFVFSLLFYSKKISIKSFFGFISGLMLIIIIFTALGYYFWLTLITGFVLTKQFAANFPVRFFEHVSKLLYFGPAFLLLFVLLLINFNKLEKKYLPICIPVILSLFILMVFLYDQGVWNRYLVQYLPAVSLFILYIDNTLVLRKRDLFISLLANFIFIHLNAYF